MGDLGRSRDYDPTPKMLFPQSVESVQPMTLESTSYNSQVLPVVGIMNSG